jgi:hypothetical protein
MKPKVVRSCILCISLIVVGLIFTGVSNAKIDPKTVVGMWLLDDGEGDVVKDSSGNGNDGAIVKSKWGPGKFGKALEFNGVDSVVNTTDEPFNLTDDMTIIARFKTSSSGRQTIVAKHNCGSGNGYFLLLNWDGSPCPAGNSVAWYHVAPGAAICSQEGLADDKWHFVAASRSGSKLFLNVDGTKKEGNGAGKYIANNVPLTMGLIGCGYAFSGLIDEVAVFNVALADDEITNLMNNGIQKASSVSPKGLLTTVWGELRK